MFDPGQDSVPGLRLTQRLGAGGCGEVWEALRPDGSAVALKFLDCRNQHSQLVANEIRMLLKLRELRHPNMIRLLDIIALPKYIVLVMDRADGNLAELQQIYIEETGKQIPCEHLLDLLEQAAEGLDFLAEQPRPGLCGGGHGMQHCDVKPSNLLILQDRLKIADFGLCIGTLSRTPGGGFMGTPPYAAPELYEGKVTATTDQYALAVTFCELVTGGRAMQPRGVAARPGECPINLKKVRAGEHAVLARAVDSNWMNRWPSCRAFVTALREALARPRSLDRKLGSRQLQGMKR